MSFFDEVIRIITDQDPKPNKYTVAIGKLLKSAREEANLSQGDLSKKVYRRRATISDMENGKADIDMVLLTLFAHVLNKPITYFFPTHLHRLDKVDLTQLEQELLIWFRKLPEDDIRILAIEQIKVLSRMGVNHLE